MSTTDRHNATKSADARSSQMTRGSDGRPARLQDIADLAHTSVATVSMALAGSRRISEKTRQRIRQISQEIGYRPRRSASTSFPKAAEVQRKIRVGFLVYDRIDQPNNALLLQTMSSIAVEENVRIELAVVDPRDTETKLLDCALDIASHVDGLILVGPVSVPQLREIQAAGIPAVMFGYPLDAADENELPVPVVTCDWQAMGHRATREMFALGHKRVAFFSGHLTPGMIHERSLDGYTLAHHHAGITPDKRHRFILPTSIDIQTTNETTLQAAKKIQAMKQPPTAYVFINTGNAQRLHDAMKQIQAAFEPDHAIIAHKDLTDNPFPHEPVMIHIDIQAMAKAAFAQLRAKCHHPQSTNTVLHVPFTLRRPAK